MDWAKLDAGIAFNPKAAGLSDGAFRAMVHLWGWAMGQETGGHVPPVVVAVVPRVTTKRLDELERLGFLDRNGDSGWRIHDWEEHQSEAVALAERRRAERERSARRRAQSGE